LPIVPITLEPNHRHVGSRAARLNDRLKRLSPTLMKNDDPKRGGAEGETVLIFDGECPVCTLYSNTAECGGGLTRIDARRDQAAMKQATEAGLDLDQGMVVVHKGQLYHGADALNIIAKLAPSSGTANRLNRLLFGSRTLSRLIYPLLRVGRGLLLALLGRSKIRNLESDSAAPR
jgi:predicted DCC family thiol-disulfide oxidoreductase YuxK